MAAKKEAPKAAKENKDVLVYRVAGLANSISHGSEIYPVEDGRVVLPNLPQHQCWYQHLVDAGLLIAEE